MRPLQKSLSSYVLAESHRYLRKVCVEHVIKYCLPALQLSTSSGEMGLRIIAVSLVFPICLVAFADSLCCPWYLTKVRDIIAISMLLSVL